MNKDHPDYYKMKNVNEALFDIYQACKDIPDWIENLRSHIDPEDIEYLERLVKLDQS